MKQLPDVFEPLSSGSSSSVAAAPNGTGVHGAIVGAGVGASARAEARAGTVSIAEPAAPTAPTAPTAPGASALSLPLLQTDRPGHCVDSAPLLAPHGRLTIRHRGRFYELRETAQGKLILTA
ncbi:MAG: hemin uptake protein HemP [Burkholderiaceae bacterium]